MQMIGLQATELYLQTEEAYFRAVIFLFLLFHPCLVVLFSYLGPLFFLKMLLLHSTGSDEIKMHYSFVDSCSIHSMVESGICILNSTTVETGLFPFHPFLPKNLTCRSVSGERNVLISVGYYLKELIFR